MQGFICFFDILGYSAFLESDSTAETAEHVLKLITSSGDRVDTLLDMLFERVPNQDYGSLNHIFKNKYSSLREPRETSDWIIWSDSIVLTVPFSPSSGSEPADIWHNLRFAFYTVLSASALAEQMFLAGLPVRGVVHFGEFFRKDACLAGKGVIEAYKLSNKLDLAAIVMTSAAHQFTRIVRKDVPAFPLFPKSVEEYDVPFNDGTQQRLPVIIACDWRRTILHSLRDSIYNSFSAHGKRMEAGAIQKADNTIKMWRTVPRQKMQGDPELSDCP